MKRITVLILFLIAILAVCTASAGQEFRKDYGNQAFVPGQVINIDFRPEFIAERAGERIADEIDITGMTVTVSAPEVLQRVATSSDVFSFLALQAGSCTVKCTTADGKYTFTDEITVVDTHLSKSSGWLLNDVPLEEVRSIPDFTEIRLTGPSVEQTDIYVNGNKDYLEIDIDGSMYFSFSADQTADVADIVLVETKDSYSTVWLEKEQKVITSDVRAMTRIQIPVSHMEEDKNFVLIADTTEPLVNSTVRVRTEGCAGTWNLVAFHDTANGIGYLSYAENDQLLPDADRSILSNAGHIFAVDSATGRRSPILTLTETILGYITSSVPALDGIPVTEVKEISSGRVYRMTPPEEDRGKYGISLDCGDFPGINSENGETLLCLIPGFSGEITLHLYYCHTPGYIWEDPFAQPLEEITLNVTAGQEPSADLRGVNSQSGGSFETSTENMLLFMAYDDAVMASEVYTGKAVGTTGITRYNTGHSNSLYWIANENGVCSPLTPLASGIRTSSLDADSFSFLLDGKPFSSYDVLSTAHTYQAEGLTIPGYNEWGLVIEGDTTYYKIQSDLDDGCDSVFVFSLTAATDIQDIYLELDSWERILLYSGPVVAAGGIEVPDTDDLPQKIDLLYDGQWTFPELLEADKGINLIFDMQKEHHWSVELNGQTLFTDRTDLSNIDGDFRYPEILSELDWEEYYDSRYHVWSRFATAEDIPLHSLVLRYALPGGEEQVYPLAMGTGTIEGEVLSHDESRLPLGGDYPVDVFVTDEFGSSTDIRFKFKHEHNWTLEVNGFPVLTNSTDGSDPGSYAETLVVLEFENRFIYNELYYYHMSFRLKDGTPVETLQLRYSLPEGEETVLPLEFNGLPQSRQ